MQLKRVISSLKTVKKTDVDEKSSAAKKKKAGKGIRGHDKLIPY